MSKGNGTGISIDRKGTKGQGFDVSDTMGGNMKIDPYTY